MTALKKKAAPAGRPPFPPGKARVVLPAQRVAPATLKKLRSRARGHGGLGRVIDAALARF